MNMDDDQFDRLDVLLEHHEDIGTRQISQEPERISDESFTRICSNCCSGVEGLTDVLQPLLDKLASIGTDRSDPNAAYERGTVLREIISEVLTRIDDFRSLEQYLWLVKFSVGLSLLQNVPAGISFETNRVIRAVSNLDTETYEFDPLMIHTIAKNLLEDIPLDGMNLIHVIKKLAVLNQKLFYYVSTTLIFAGICRYTAEAEPTPIKMYRLHSFPEVLAQLETLKIGDLQRKLDIRRLFLLLKLLSAYQNAVILRHSAVVRRDVEEQHQCFAEFFRVSLVEKKVYLRWLCTVRNVVSSLNSKSCLQKIADKEDFLLVIELIDLDMIPLMEDDIGEEK
ncbi:uncharacterized protein LOC131676483 [Topomyia yanbarensis]|uniref:uncharacterized protein LOC131676483 n=1 Tax=Topomyia yanbarensis TaxID=2498891 RepID=UPI00273B2D44|nr:uncharacterized protein LOC131676483 [Topomyia yanbarensis]